MVGLQQGGSMRKVWLLACLVGITVGFAAWASPLAGSWTFAIEVDPEASSLDAMLEVESVLEIDYTFSTWTWESTVLVGNDGLDNMFIDAHGPLGAFGVRSIIDFDAANAAFRAWLASARTAIGGVNLYGMLMVDRLRDVATECHPATGAGWTLGGWGHAGPVTIYAQTRFGMTDTSTLVYKYGYNWLLDHFIFTACDQWYKPSGYIDVQTGGCTLAWTGADIQIEMPFGCADVLAQLSFSCSGGFDQILFEFQNIDLGLPVINIAWMDIVFTVDSKSVATVFDVTLDEMVCITPYLALEGLGTSIEGLSLKALKMQYSWNGITFKAGELLDLDGWYQYLNYSSESTRVLGFGWNGELTTMWDCLASYGERTPYNEYFGLIIDGDACCGGKYDASLFAWFNTGQGGTHAGSSGLFDWAETRASMRLGIGSQFTASFALSVKTSGVNWIRVGGRFDW